jgi:hypothetical protein
VKSRIQKSESASQNIRLRTALTDFLFFSSVLIEQASVHPLSSL